MEIVVTLKTIEDINLAGDSFILGTTFGVRNDIFTLEEIKYVKLNTNKNVYVNLDRVIHEDELDKLESFLNELKKINVDGIYFSDLSIFTISEDLGLIDKLIYNPGTLVTNYVDVQFYLTLGIKRVCLSREITLEDINEIMNHTKDVEVIIHGKLNMFYSKRKLLTNFFSYTKQKIEKKGHLIEEIRDEKYPIIEDETGTHIFQGNTLNSFKELSEFNDITVRIDGYLFDQEYVEDVLNIYNEIRNGMNSSEAFNNYSVKYDSDELFSGYYYKETNYMKK
ncbi:U32 family peptidase [Mycoplasmatota bacterium WC44]